MAALAKRMVIRQETDEITPDAAYQGAMALALLLDSWQGTDVRLVVRTIDAQKSRFASWVMAARPMEQRNQPIRLLMLVKDQQEALLGLVDAENGLTLAAQIGDIWDMLPERATWVNREDKCFGSPLPLLNEADCDLLLAGDDESAEFCGAGRKFADGHGKLADAVLHGGNGRGERGA